MSLALRLSTWPTFRATSVASSITLSIGGDYPEYQEDEIRKFAQSIPKTHNGWPIVSLETGQQQTIYAHCSITELGSTAPYSLMSRTQLSLIAAWAITIHKSQGMTIDNAVVYVDGAWEQAQVYVAMSRVKTLDGLLVSGLSADQAMRAGPTVNESMQSFTG